jgi:DNA-binding transcriptional ArsR family regulator
MGVTKAELFTTAQNEVAQIAKVLAHPARVAIIELLLNSNKCITGDIVEEIGTINNKPVMTPIHK